jgi:hypothetical protein
MPQDSTTESSSTHSLLELFGAMEEEGQRLALVLGVEPAVISAWLGRGGALVDSVFRNVTHGLGLGPDVDGLIKDLAKVKAERESFSAQNAKLQSVLDRLDTRMAKLELVTQRAKALNRSLDERLVQLERAMKVKRPAAPSSTMESAAEVPARAVRALDSVLKIAAERAASIFSDPEPSISVTGQAETPPAQKPVSTTGFAATSHAEANGSNPKENI